MGPRATAALSMRLEAELQRRRMLVTGGEADRARFRFAVATRGGAACFASTDMGGFAPRVLGFGLFAPPAERGLDAIRRYFAERGMPARIVVCEGPAPLAAIRLLERAGFARDENVGAGWVRHPDRAPVRPPPRGIAVERVDPHRGATLARAIRAGFEHRGRWRFFARSTARLLVERPLSTHAFLARREGAVAGSGCLLVHRGAGLLFAGSVLGPHRGRGAQPALIAERLTYGWARGARVFFGQTAPDNASAHNVRDAGFERLAVLAAWVKRD